MNRRHLLAAIPLLAFAPLPQAQPTVAEIVYGPQPITSPSGETFWMAAVKGGAFAVPEFETLWAMYEQGQWSLVELDAAIRAAGAIVLIDGWPNRWDGQRQVWAPML
jgi:hypothetical protein